MNLFGPKIDFNVTSKLSVSEGKKSQFLVNFVVNRTATDFGGAHETKKLNKSQTVYETGRMT
jgi:hypothetical protein